MSKLLPWDVHKIDCALCMRILEAVVNFGFSLQKMKKEILTEKNKKKSYG